MASSVGTRNTTWTFACYGESMPEDWEQRMRDLHVPLAYVLHDSDVKDDGTPDKPHYHVLVKYDSLKSLDQVRNDFAFTGIAYFEPVRAFKSMCRYLIHLDDPDKHQYPRESIIEVSGISLDFSRRYSKDEELQMLSEMTEFVEDNDIFEFSVLWKHAAIHNPRWLEILAGKSAYGISQYIRSRRCGSKERNHLGKPSNEE